MLKSANVHNREVDSSLHMFASTSSKRTITVQFITMAVVVRKSSSDPAGQGAPFPAFR